MPDLEFSDVHTYVDAFAAGDTAINSTSEQFSRADLSAFLRQNVAELAEAVLVMTPAQLAYRPSGAPQGWDTSGDEQHFDALEIVTHVASGITFHWWGIARALGHPRPEFPRPPEGLTVTGKTRNMLGAGGWTGVPSMLRYRFCGRRPTASCSTSKVCPAPLIAARPPAWAFSSILRRIAGFSWMPSTRPCTSNNSKRCRRNQTTPLHRRRRGSMTRT